MPRLHHLIFSVLLSVALVAFVGCGRTDYSQAGGGQSSGAVTSGGAAGGGAGGGASGGGATSSTSGGGASSGGSTGVGVTGGSGGGASDGGMTGGSTGGGGASGGGMTGGGGDTGGTTRDVCYEACEYLNGCLFQMCDQEIFGVEECLSQCDQFPSEEILSLTCDDLNASVCESNPGLEQVCDCGDVDPGEGEGSCGELLECFQRCREGDDACNEDCFLQTSSDGQELYEEVLECAEDNCLGQDGRCLREICSEELLDCYRDGDGSGVFEAYCLDTCDPFDPGDMSCGGGTFCYDVQQGFGVCAGGDPDGPEFPDGALPCRRERDCDDGQVCVQGG